jgi:hypothetical protein
MKLGRAGIAFVLSVAVLGVAAVAAAQAPSPPAPEPMPVEDPGSGGGMAMCVEGVPDCDDMIVLPDPGTGAGMDDPTASCPVGTPDCVDTPMGPPGEPQVVTPTPGMSNVRARPFDTATVGDDGTTVTIDFVSGVEPCYVLDHVDVAYGTDAVTITLFEGSDPEAGDVACIEIGVFKRTIVTLDEPLGDRTIVDGGLS